VALNEMRVDFTPTLWDVDPRVAQMLFVGAHADVGGGYPESDDESALSDAALKWMAAELVQLGVRFSIWRVVVSLFGGREPAIRSPDRFGA
jgi:hypothetical protein